MKRFYFSWLSDHRQAIMGFSIIWIVFYHSSFALGKLRVVSLIKNFGNLGVDIFLYLSAIGLFYSASKIKTKNTSEVWKQFYKKRIIRILPATVICLIPWYLWLYRGQQINPVVFILNITSISFWFDGSNRGWYVALTLFLYLLYPLIYSLIKKHRTDRRLLLCEATLLVAFDICINTVIAITYPAWFRLVNLALCRVSVFIVGCFLAPKVYKHDDCSFIIVLLAIIGSVFISLLIVFFREQLQLYAIWRYMYGVLGIFVAIILATVFQFLKKSIIYRLFAFLGEYTLEIYLTHTQILSVAEEFLGKSSIIANLLSIAISIGVSIIIHKVLSSFCR